MFGSEIEMPFSAKDCKGKNYELVVNMFKDAGFTNITTTSIADVKIGLLKKDGNVEYASINGDAKFKKRHDYDKNATVRIVYHTKEK